MKVDFHTHPLIHRYYPKILPDLELTDSDKRSVELMVDFSVKRKLDAVAITDHNVFTSSFYAQRYVKEKQLPLKIITGAECSIQVLKTEAHFLALGVKEPVAFAFDDPVEKFVERVHAVGGIVVLAHPVYYPEIYEKVKPFLDGVEYYNGVSAILHPYMKKFITADRDGFQGIKTYGSDYHPCTLMEQEQLDAVANVSLETLLTLGLLEE